MTAAERQARHKKAMADRLAALERAAQARSEPAPPRLMPERWFYGQTMNWPIAQVARCEPAFMRPLAEDERFLGRFIVPSFQRPLVWTKRQKARLIESIYQGMPIGSLVDNETRHDDPCDGWLLDGQQRTNAICEYLAGEFAVMGWRYPELPEIEQRHFQRMGVPVIQTAISDPAMCQEVYDRLVYGGTAH
jgi:hypothetical protein